jgi:hypothetical protein
MGVLVLKMPQIVENECVIVVIPVLIPPTTPVVASIVAIAGLLLLHVPPMVLLVNVTEAPGQIVDGLVMVSGSGIAFTVTFFVAAQVGTKW